MTPERPKPLSITTALLSPASISGLLQTSSVGSQGWKILDRWAMTQPAELKALAEGPHGLLPLLHRLLGQQAREMEALTSPEGLRQMKDGLAEHEVLTLAGVDMAL